MTVADAISIIVALAALVLAFVSFRKSNGIDERLAAIEIERRGEEVERREEELELRRSADVTAVGRGPEHKVKIINRGPARATDVSLTPDDRIKNWFVHGELAQLPVSLDAGQEYPLMAVPTADDPPFGDVHLTWRDGRGPQSHTVRVNLT